MIRPKTHIVRAALLLCIASLSLSATAQVSAKQSTATRAATRASPIDIAINKAERQSMLSQRAVKLYAQVALGISPARSEQLLTETIEQFESELRWLRANTPNAALRPGIEAQAKAWDALKAYLTKPAARDNIDEVGALGEDLYAKTQATALATEALTADPLDESVAKSAKQRVLIQRLGKLYMFERAGFKDAKRLFDSVKQEFLSGHKALQTATGTNDVIRRELDLINGQAQMLFTNFVDSRIGGANNDALVGKAIEVMMQMQDAVTTLYEKL
jgi:hypothetical protein